MATLDIRANVFCNLGPILSGSIADEYAQGSGLVRCRGNLEIAGLVTPAVGSRVQIGYEKEGRVARISRYLRVISTFTNPYQKTTSVTVGCPITYADQLSEPTEKAKNKEENSDVLCSIYRTGAAPSMTADYIYQKAMDKIGLAGPAGFLRNAFAIDEFSYANGYTSVISDLLVSENYVGYVNAAGALEVVNMQNLSLTGPRVGPEKSISLEPIGFGDLPASEVTVDYSYTRLKKPEDLASLTDEEKERRNWEGEETFGSPVWVEVSYTDYNDGNSDPVERVLGTSYIPTETSKTVYDVWDRVVYRETTRNSVSGEVNGSFIASLLSESSKPDSGTGFTVVDITIPITFKTRTDFNYKVPAPLATPSTDPEDGELASECVEQEKPDDYTEVVSEVTVEYGPFSSLASTLPVRHYIDGPGGGPVSIPNGTGPISRTTILYDKDEESGITKVTTIRESSRSGNLYFQQTAAAVSNRSFDLPSPEALASMQRLVDQAAYSSEREVEVRIRTEREYGLQRRPSASERTKSALSGETPLETTSEQEFLSEAIGPAIKRSFSMPYASDDKVTWDAINGFQKTESNAPEAARSFGEIQNKLVFGNRYGVSLRTFIDCLPTYPLQAFYIDAEGNSGQFLSNGTSMSFDSNGILVQVDGLFWGIHGLIAGGGDNWLPIPSGVTPPTIGPPNTSPNPTPANSIPTPGGFDPSNPGNIFDSIPENQDAVFAEWYSPSSIVPPYSTKVAFRAVTTVNLLTAQPIPWDRSPSTENSFITITNTLSSSPAWEPDPADFSLMLLSTAGLTLTGAGNDEVSNWQSSAPDASSFGGGTNPLLLTAAINGIDSIRFNRTNGEDMYGPNLSNFASDSSFGYFIVAKVVSCVRNGSNGYDNEYIIGDDGGYFGCYARAGGLVGTFIYVSGSTYKAETSLPTGEWSVIYCQLSGGNISISTDGQTPVATAAPNKTTNQGLNINYGYSFEYRADTEIAEIDFYSTAPDQNTVDTMTGYLAWKYNLESRLPLGHPYKDAPP